MRGTASSNFQQIYDRLESAGASFGYGASVHTTSFSGQALAEDLPLLYSTLAETLIEPIFPEDQFNRLKSQLLTSLAIRAQSTQDMAAIEFDSILFPNHPLRATRGWIYRDHQRDLPPGPGGFPPQPLQPCRHDHRRGWRGTT